MQAKNPPSTGARTSMSPELRHMLAATVHQGAHAGPLPSVIHPLWQSEKRMRLPDAFKRPAHRCTTTWCER